MTGNIAVILVPVVLLIVLAVWSGLLNKKCRFELPPEPLWPLAENQGLALELADSQESVNAILGPANAQPGQKNRETAIRFQKMDFVLIPLYVAFLAAAALVLGGPRAAIPAIALACAAGFFDVFEDIQIIRMARGDARSSARRFGKLKWFFFFAAIAGDGVLLILADSRTAARGAAGALLGAALVLTAAAGLIAAARGAFTAIVSAARLSILGFLALALLPLVFLAPFPWRGVAEYAFLMRVPVITGLILLALPFLAFFTGAKSLLKGLFDLTPPSMFVVTLAALALAGTVCMNASVILFHASERFGAVPLPWDALPPGWRWLWLLFMLILAAPAIVTSLGFSAHQKRPWAPLALAALGGMAVAAPVAGLVVYWGTALATAAKLWLNRWGVETLLTSSNLFYGYADPLAPHDPFVDHLSAGVAFAAVLLLYAVTGVYGYLRLGRSRTVPALASALLLLTMLCWMLSAAGFFFDQWRIPLLLIVFAAGTLTAQSTRADNFYQLRDRESGAAAAADPGETLTASKTRRAIVVAANGGGIQAGAWAAQVLHGLFEDSQQSFLPSLRMISSVSGGSVGSACFVHWMANPGSSKSPQDAAAASSLDEVAWGMAWTDLLRALLPWVCGRLIGRGRALERAWRLNSIRTLAELPQLDHPLSSWNARVAAGELPGMVMNATIAETGERLLLATTGMGHGEVQGRARVDAAALHRINGQARDVGIVTAARLSASFPYVTPAARSDAPGPQPHIVDGGYYDNYGMATMVEWLDAALAGAGGKIDSVLVIQIHGAPASENSPGERHAKSRGWFYQAIAPLTTLAAVRGSGQIAHNNIELGLLQQKWMDAGIPVHSVTFEFHNPDAPLSWHLTPNEVANIRTAWRDGMTPCRKLVGAFLAGNDRLDCGCPRCSARP